ncbi:hypothetical protein [Pedobacter rhizosphaerae]|uniref:DUF4440 domain-containing protein n=1 Tax=Pedobacter rhizosphaerae TaxID=390241 RepID=A0A1H9S9D6_9SPHI|nr:hypothetical protein [Pedobacter rhizosphaerae]SER81620.1 hypothetical protein SAMN04488023_11735 [Pedobacter rhizosphaerae]
MRNTMILLCLLIGITASAQKPVTKGVQLDLTKVSNLQIKTAITALQNNDARTWFSLFTPNVIFCYDGYQTSFKGFFRKSFGHEHFTSIDRVENNGLDIYGSFHSDQWGDFKTYFKFQLNKSGKIWRLDVGQAAY